MKQDTLQGAEKYTKAHQRRKRWYQVVTGLACVVVFCTVYALILPAITMEKGACEIPEHTHSEACYTQVTSATRTEPVCTIKSLNLHQHDDTCYDSEGNLTCGYADFVVHQHDSACYDENGNLWCPLPEIETHEHTGSCYAVPETSAEVHTHTDDCYTMERGELICTESTEPAHVHTDDCYTETSALVCEEDHEHTESCYETTRELTCGYTEEPAHQHTDQCYEQIKTLICDLSTEPVGEAEPAEPELICDKTEVILHEHTSDCFDDGNLICGKIQVLEHQHTDACFETVEEPVDTEALTCTLPEDENHTHGPLCYGTWELTCDLEEHTHSEACQPAELTEEEQAQVEEVIALIDALPASEEIEETAAAFEKAEDEDSLEAYLSEIYPQVSAAYEAYSALTDAQKAEVTNADKLMELEWIWSATTLETSFPVLTGDGARVSGITVTGISDGVTPWDADNNPGNDSSPDNKIVRTFDTVTYNFEAQMESYDSTSYSEARVKLEFVLPLTAEQAVFDQTAMAWMDQTTGYAPVLTTETRSINGVDTQCQVLTCYKRLLPSEGHQSVVPGAFGENVTVNVKSMKNGDTFAPIFSAAMEHGTWEGNCSTHNNQEKYSVQAEKVRVSATPKYNVQIGGASAYKGTFDFNTGNSTAQGYDGGYGIGSVVGRVIRIGLTLQLYNDNASKGFKGIELPNGSPITFDISLGSSYRINTPNSGYTQGQVVSVTDAYMPRLWSCDGNAWTGYGATNSDGRVLNDDRGCADQYAPWNQGGDMYSCYRGGSWIATQEGSTVHVTVSGYQINVDKMPTKNGDSGGAYGPELGIGCFSAGELWIVQPYNKIGSTGTNPGPEFDIVQDYGQGAFTTDITAMNMKATTVSGVSFQDLNGTNDAQTKKTDDRMSPTLELTLPGGLQNRVSYASVQNLDKGVGVDNYRDGLDYGTPGTPLYLKAGFSYSTRNEEDNILYWGTNLTKFYASAIELTGGKVWPELINGAKATVTVLYATKQDGADWTSDLELQHTYEDALVFYNSIHEIPAGHKCVGLLYCFKGPGPLNAADPYYYVSVCAKIRDDMNLAGNTYMLASTSRVWTKSMFERAGMTLDSIPDWTNSTTKLSSFPTGAYTSANIGGSVWYTKETYAADGSGALGTHNSDWRHWGDTLLVIGYKTGITKTLCQTSDDGTTKSTYNLDANQRVVDFKLQPRTYYDQGSGNHALTTTVTIVDTLPKYLTYRPGSCYFGGVYTQTSVNGGTQGSVTGGSLREPDSVVNNADGTQTLTWIIPNVTVGEEMPTIYYSANIGNRNDPNQDVPTGTTHLLNTVRITATHDLRQPTIANGNYAEAGIAVTRGTASSFGKYSKQTLVEPDGVIDYVVYYDNNSVSAADVVMLDTMPYNGVNGSHFTGSYSVNSWKLDVSKCAIDKLAFYYTTDNQYKNATTASLGGNETAKATIQGWTSAAIASDGTVTVMNGTQPVAWAIIGTLDSNKSVNVDMQIQLKPDQSTAGNRIENNYYVNTLSSGETTITTENPTVNRTLEGLTWMDDSADGLQNEADARRISGVKVTLMKLKDGGNPSNEADYEPYHYQGDPSKPVVVIETGKIVSVLANSSADATAYELGRYKFIDLPAGTFAVKFEDGSTKISPFIASPANRGGSDDTIDSDGIAVYNSDKSQLLKTVILDIDMPKAEEMSVVLYEFKYHDSGFYERGYELPNTGGAGTVPYTMGGLLLLTGAAFLLLYNHTKRRKEDFASS